MVSNFKLFVQIGRAARIKNAVHKGQIVVIVDILDAHRYMVEGPNVPRTLITTRDIELVNIVVNVARGAASADVQKAIAEQKLVEQYEQTGLFKRDNRSQKRQNLTDFERFVVKSLKKQKKQLILKEYAPIKAASDNVKAEADKKAALELHKKAFAKKMATKASFKLLGKKIAKKAKATKAFQARQAAKAN